MGGDTMARDPLWEHVQGGALTNGRRQTRYVVEIPARNFPFRPRTGFAFVVHQDDVAADAVLHLALNHAVKTLDERIRR